MPYIPQPELQIGPLTLHAFGALVAMAVLVGVTLVNRRAGREGLDLGITNRLVHWILGGGFLGAHLADRLVYFPAETLAHPWSLLTIWEGLSSLGGFLGAVIGAALFLRRERLHVEGWRYLDAIAYALPLGWFFGRLGCFLAFDHPGRPTTFVLGEKYLDGVVRHNLGLEEALYMLAIAALFFALGRRRHAPGFFTGLLALVYAPVRFCLDFLRIVDVRYFGLTPGHYGAIALFVAGVLILRKSERLPTPPRVTPRQPLPKCVRSDST
jgi:phosphatidylglycerol:prolipoprotein diacylglycerol transferase